MNSYKAFSTDLYRKILAGLLIVFVIGALYVSSTQEPTGYVTYTGQGDPLIYPTYGIKSGEKMTLDISRIYCGPESWMIVTPASSGEAWSPANAGILKSDEDYKAVFQWDGSSRNEDMSSEDRVMPYDKYNFIIGCYDGWPPDNPLSAQRIGVLKDYYFYKYESHSGAGGVACGSEKNCEVGKALDKCLGVTGDGKGACAPRNLKIDVSVSHNPAKASYSKNDVVSIIAKSRKSASIGIYVSSPGKSFAALRKSCTVFSKSCTFDLKLLEKGSYSVYATAEAGDYGGASSKIVLQVK